jgi:predicted enzyme related to lactoylglutathione lyase
MSATHGTFVWYELMCADLPAASAFYARLFGWRAAPAAGADYTLIHAGAQPLGGMMMLTPAMRSAGARPGWLGYVEVDDLALAVQRVLELGGHVHVPVTRAGEAGHFALAADPLGALFYLFHSAQTPVPDFSMAPSRVAWRELQSPDWERGFGFYQVLCGWERGDLLAGDGRGTYQVIKTAGTAAGGTCTVAGLAQGRWRYYFAVENIDAGAARVREGGGQVLEGPHPITGGMWILEATDPQGAGFALLGPR